MLQMGILMLCLAIMWAFPDYDHASFILSKFLDQFDLEYV